MIRELVELGGRNRRQDEKEGKIVHNALTKEEVNALIHITKDGIYERIQLLDESIHTICENIVAKKGKARLLLDRLEETFGLDCFDKNAAAKHKKYLEKLREYNDIREIKPVLDFYAGKKAEGIERAKQALQKEITRKELEAADEIQKNSRRSLKTSAEEAVKAKVKKIYGGNFAFFVNGGLLNTSDTVIEAIKKRYEQNQTAVKAKECSVCGEEKYPVEDLPHGMISNVPPGRKDKRVFVSFNAKAFESYRLNGNLNSQICTNCASSYVQALNWLLAPSGYTKDNKGKEHPFYNNRYDLGKDTAAVFWTRYETDFNPKAVLEKKSAADVKALFDSVRKGKSSSVQENDFYAITLSGSSARIMVRDFIHTSVEAVQKNLHLWFEDIDIGRKNGAGVTLYSPLWRMAESTRRPGDSRRNDVTPARVQLLLWKAAVQGTQVPLWALHAVINRLRMDSYKSGNKKKEPSDGSRTSDRNKKAKDADSGTLTFAQVFKPERIALIQLVLKRITRGEEDMSQQAANRREAARIYGKIFAVLAKIQYYAAQRDINVGVVNRHYSAASTTPASAFGRLFKNSRHHLEKIKASNKGLAINLDRELSELMTQVGDEFLPVLSLEDQGRFALGFYQQRSQDFSAGKIDEELEDLENAGDDETDGSIEEEDL